MMLLDWHRPDCKDFRLRPFRIHHKLVHETVRESPTLKTRPGSFPSGAPLLFLDLTLLKASQSTRLRNDGATRGNTNVHKVDSIRFLVYSGAKYVNGLVSFPHSVTDDSAKLELFISDEDVIRTYVQYANPRLSSTQPKPKGGALKSYLRDTNIAGYVAIFDTVTNVFDSLVLLRGQPDGVAGGINELKNLSSWLQVFDDWFGANRKGIPAGLDSKAVIKDIGDLDQKFAPSIDQDTHIIKFRRACERRKLKPRKTIPRKVLLEIMQEIGAFDGNLEDVKEVKRVCRYGRVLANGTHYSKGRSDTRA